MKNTNTFGVHFTLRQSREVNGKSPVYVRIVVNKSRCELALKCYLKKEDWNTARGLAKSKNEELKKLNTYLEDVRARIINHYRNLERQEMVITAEAVKNAYLGQGEQVKQKTLIEVFTQHNKEMAASLKWGTMKNYFTTAKYLKEFLTNRFPGGDIYLKQLNYEFISSFELYVRTNPIHNCDPCTQNGTMKHMERLKRVINWACKMDWLPKNPFDQYQLKFKRKERDFLTELEIKAIESHVFVTASLQEVKDLFIFSCYTGLAYCDLIELSPDQIAPDTQGRYWIYTNRMKTEIRVDVPLLSPALTILEKYKNNPAANQRKKVFPYTSNQEINRQLKLIAEAVGIKKHLTFHLARHTFATLLLMNGVPIETIKKLLGHTKITTTMIYAHVVNAKVGMDMEAFEKKMQLLPNNRIT